MLKLPLRALQVPLRAAVGAAIAVAVAQALGLPYPVFALVSAIIVTDLLPEQTRRAGLRRLVATFVGAVSGAVIIHWLPPGPIPIALGVTVAMVGAHVVQVQDGAKLAGITCAIVMLLGPETDPMWFAFHRFVETGLGVAIAWAISFVPKLLPSEGRSQ